MSRTVVVMIRDYIVTHFQLGEQFSAGVKKFRRGIWDSHAFVRN